MIATTLFSKLRVLLLAGAALGAVVMAGAGVGGARPAAASDFFLADLQVKPVSGVQLGSAGMYSFTVRNNGIADATGVVANGMCAYTWDHWVQGAGITSYSTSTDLGTVKSGETRTVNVFCQARGAKDVNVGFKVTVNANNELDMSDNSTQFGHV